MSKSSRWVAIGVSLVLVFGVWLMVKNAADLHQEINSKLEKKYGFSTTVVSIQLEGRSLEAIAIDPLENGLLHGAGFRQGDIVVSHTAIEFYGLLYRKNGQTEIVEVIRESNATGSGHTGTVEIRFEIPD